MSCHSGPNVPVNNSVVRFDSANIKSYNSVHLSSMVNNAVIPIETTVNDGFVISSNTSSNLDVGNLNTSNAISVVISAKTDNLSKGTLFSLYGDNISYYNCSGVTTFDTNNHESQAISAVSHDYTMISTGVTTFDTNNHESQAISAVSHDYIMTSTGVTTFDTNDHESQAISAVSHDYTMISTGVTTFDTNNHDLISLSEELYFDYVDQAISAYINNSTINVRFKDLDWDQKTFSIYTPLYNDVFIILFKKYPSEDNVKIYHDGNLIAQNLTTFNLSNFGSNLSLFSINSQGNRANFPIRFITIYNTELSLAEIKKISAGLRRSL